MKSKEEKNLQNRIKNKLEKAGFVVQVNSFINPNGFPDISLYHKFSYAHIEIKHSTHTTDNFCLSGLFTDLQPPFYKKNYEKMHMFCLIEHNRHFFYICVDSDFVQALINKTTFKDFKKIFKIPTFENVNQVCYYLTWRYM